MSERKASLVLIILAIVWGTGFIGCQVAFDAGLTPLQVIAGRFFVASVFLDIIFLKDLRCLTFDEIKAGVVIGFFLTVAFVFQLFGLQHSTPSINAFVTSTYVVMIPLLYFILFRKKPTFIIVLCALLTVLGVTLISVKDRLELNLGVFLTLLCALGNAFQVMTFGHYSKKYKVTSITIVMTNFTFLASFIAAALFGAVYKDFKPLNTTSVLACVYLGIICTGLALFLQGLGQKYTSAEKAAIIFSTEGIFAALFSVLIFGEKFNSKMLLGCVIIFIAILLVNMEFNTKQPLFKIFRGRLSNGRGRQKGKT